MLGDRCAHPRQEPAEPRLEDIDPEAFGVRRRVSADYSSRSNRWIAPARSLASWIRCNTWVRFEDREQSAKLRGHAEGFGIGIFQARFGQFLGPFPITLKSGLA